MTTSKKIACVLVIAIIAFISFDCFRGSVRHFECSIGAHVYKPAHVEIYTDSDGEAHTTYYPEEYHVICVVYGEQRSIDCRVNSYEYARLKDGDDVTVKARVGYVTGCLYIPTID